MPYLKTLCCTVHLPYKLHLVNVILALFITKDFELYDRSLSNMVSGYPPPPPPPSTVLRGHSSVFVNHGLGQGVGQILPVHLPLQVPHPLSSLFLLPPPLPLPLRVISSTLQKCNSTVITLTAKTLSRKFDTNIPRNETARPRPNSYIHASVSDLYIPTVGLPILLREKRWTDRGCI